MEGLEPLCQGWKVVNVVQEMVMKRGIGQQNDTQSSTGIAHKYNQSINLGMFST